VSQGVDRHTSFGARCREPASDSRVPNPDWKAEAAGGGDDDASGDSRPEDVGWTDAQVQALIDCHGGVGEQSEAS
jgi:hypothetical protein